MPGGRPTKYKDEYAEQAYKLCLLGATNEDLANFFEVAVSTIDKWISEIEEFSGALKRVRRWLTQMSQVASITAQWAMSIKKTT